MNAKLTDTSAAVREKYCGEFFDEIKTFWKNLNESNEEIATELFEKWSEPTWWAKVEEQHQRLKESSLWGKFVVNFRENLREVCVKTDFLLPDTENAYNFLPVALMAYLSNIKQLRPFADELYEQDIVLESDINKKVTCFVIAKWKKMYSSLTAADCKVTNTGRTIPVYLNIIQFLALLVGTADVCNVSLSFYTYNCMTGLLDLLGSDAQRIIDIMDSDGEEALYNDKYQRDILILTNKVLDDFVTSGNLSLKKPKNLPRENDIQDSYGLSFRFLTFLANLQDALLEDPELISPDPALEFVRAININLREVLDMPYAPLEFNELKDIDTENQE